VKNYIGIDLGTSNSAIASYDGENLRIYKSPDQNDVTPSAIFIDRRGNKYLGKHAYDSAAKQPDNAATKFKKMMGTSTPVKLSAVNLIMTPEECSSEILKVCFGYLPEEIRNDPETGTVITVPAAFNQMQKDATMAAAEMAGLGKVALMQEPVAAVMCVMQKRKNDGVFLVYDLGGGTLDIAIAESTSGRVSLHAHGGIAMCGGTEFDQMILNNVVKPWLFENFDLPDDLTVNAKYKSLLRTATWAAEHAKIRLSSSEEAVIALPENEVGVKDESGTEIYLDIPFVRKTLDGLMAEKIADSIQAARETIEKAGLSHDDIERIVFVGGPTNYKPLRDKVAFELGIEASTEVNPMTAVAEGAAVFAESIDWSSQSRSRKSTRGAVSAGGDLNISFAYTARTPANKAKIMVKLGGAAIPGAEFKVDSLDTGWDSGRIALKDAATLDVTLPKMGDNTFKVWIFDAKGGPVKFENNKIVITRTTAELAGIPASSSIGIEVNERGRSELEYLIHEGDQLPKKGTSKFKSKTSLRAGASGEPLRFKIWEGEIKEPVTDNRYVGEFLIKGSDFDEGVISQGAELICEYEVLDSGQIILEVSVPSVSGTFRSGNFYSRGAGAKNYEDESKRVLNDADIMRERVESILSKVDDEKLGRALEKLDQASALQHDESDPETNKQADDNIHEAKKLLAQVRQEHVKEIRQLDLDLCMEYFEQQVREHAKPTEATKFDNLVRTAQRAIEKNGIDFENYVDELRSINFMVLWRQDWFVIARFKWLAEDVYLFTDKQQHAELVKAGAAAISSDDIGKLRQVVAHLDSQRVGSGSDDDILSSSNIARG
jgi:molecular chaperone DnaK